MDRLAAPTSPTAAVTLDVLPTELQRLILMFASSSTPLSTLSAWSLVNKRWNDALQRLIFYRVPMRASGTQKFCQLMEDKEERKTWVKRLALRISSLEGLPRGQLLLDGLSNLRRLTLLLGVWDNVRLPPLKQLTQLALICVPPSPHGGGMQGYHPPNLKDLISDFGSYGSLDRLIRQGISNPLPKTPGKKGKRLTN
ncbi:hypothetical protein BT69DRAFT_1317791 [Atractiella rhizophila]|nr:hypothetical protein BT69DRAFT_1317791 [Atractiella rhizophila]